MKPLTQVAPHPILLGLAGSSADRHDLAARNRGQPSGAVVGGADVSISEAASGFHATRKTAANGEYIFPQIAPGRYSISVNSTGFSNQVKNTELLVSQPATVDFILSMSTMQEVEVDAATVTLDSSDASLGNALNNATIEALPSEGRNVPDLLSLQPGVVYLGRQINRGARDHRSGAVAGAHSDQSNVTLDGVDNNDQTKGYAFTGILRSTLDSVGVRVTTTSSNADSGRSPAPGEHRHQERDQHLQGAL